MSENYSFTHVKQFNQKFSTPCMECWSPWHRDKSKPPQRYLFASWMLHFSTGCHSCELKTCSWWSIFDPAFKRSHRAPHVMHSWPFLIRFYFMNVGVRYIRLWVCSIYLLLWPFSCPSIFPPEILIFLCPVPSNDELFRENTFHVMTHHCRFCKWENILAWL